jgi:hypothetical protein
MSMLEDNSIGALLNERAVIDASDSLFLDPPGATALP